MEKIPDNDNDDPMRTVRGITYGIAIGLFLWIIILYVVGAYICLK